MRFILPAAPWRAISTDWLEAEGFQVHKILGVADAAMTELMDADATKQSVPAQRYDWLIVDHYELGAAWERAMAALADRIFVIDDLGRASRLRSVARPELRKSDPCALFNTARRRLRMCCSARNSPCCGPEFAALRAGVARAAAGTQSPGFWFAWAAAIRSMKPEGFGRSFAAAATQLYIDVAIGAGNPHRSAVEAACAGLRHATLHVQASNMAELMAAADCAICGAGNITWERCALGLPGLATIMADNQASAAAAVDAAGAHQLLGWHHSLVAEDYARAVLAVDLAKLRRMSAAAAAICDGGGVKRVAERLSRNGRRTKRSLRAARA